MNITMEDIEKSNLVHVDDISSATETGSFIAHAIYFKDIGDLNAFFEEQLNKKVKEALESETTPEELLKTSAIVKTVPIIPNVTQKMGLADSIIRSYRQSGNLYEFVEELDADSELNKRETPDWLVESMTSLDRESGPTATIPPHLLASWIYRAMVDDYESPESVEPTTAMRLGLQAQQFASRHGTGTTNWAYAISYFYAKFFNAINTEKK